jgi:hypothetical protein
MVERGIPTQKESGINGGLMNAPINAGASATIALNYLLLGLKISHNF